MHQIQSTGDEVAAEPWELKQNCLPGWSVTYTSDVHCRTRMAEELEAPGIFESGSEELAEYYRIGALKICCKKHLDPKISSLTAQRQTTAQVSLKRAQGN